MLSLSILSQPGLSNLTKLEFSSPQILTEIGQKQSLHIRFILDLLIM